MDRTEDQPRAKHDQTKVQEQQRHHFFNPVKARRGDQRAEHGQRQSEDGDTGAQRSQRSSFLSEEHLDLAKNYVVRRR